jgi:hypothetical protein
VEYKTKRRRRLPPGVIFVTPVFRVLSNYPVEEYAEPVGPPATQCGGQKDEVESRDGIPIKVDRGRAVGSDEQQLDEGNIKGDHYAKNL